jgi:hypothetical protein
MTPRRRSPAAGRPLNRLPAASDVDDGLAGDPSLASQYILPGQTVLEARPPGQSEYATATATQPPQSGPPTQVADAHPPFRDPYRFLPDQASSIQALGPFFFMLQLLGVFIDRSTKKVQLLKSATIWTALGVITFCSAFAPLFGSSSWRPIYFWGLPGAICAFWLAGIVIIYFATWSVGSAQQSPVDAEEIFNVSDSALRLIDRTKALPSIRLTHAKLAQVNDEFTQRWAAQQAKFFQDILLHSEDDDVRSFASVFFKVIVLCLVATLPAMTVFVIVGRSYDFFANDITWSNASLVAVWCIPAYLCEFIVWCVYGILLTCLWLLKKQIDQFTFWCTEAIDIKILSTLPGDTVEANISLDFVIRERYLLSLLIDRSCGRISVAVTIGNTCIAFVIILCILYMRTYGWQPLPLILGIVVIIFFYGTLYISSIVLQNTFTSCIIIFEFVEYFPNFPSVILWTLSLLDIGNELFMSALLDIRGRFPCAYEPHWRYEQSQMRMELDSIITHCKNTPVSFEFFGIRITYNLVAGFTYSTVFGVSSVIASYFFRQY